MERLTEKQRHILQQKLCDMKRRCYNPEEKFYKDYGGRGMKAKRANRASPVSEILLMMFRSANRDYRKTVKKLEEMEK